jgi:hypothetical protein
VTAADPLALWARSVRREFRDYVRQVGKVPSLAFYVSTRNNPRKANAWMRADIAADADVAWNRLREMAEERGVGPWREGAFRFDLGEARAALP